MNRQQTLFFLLIGAAVAYVYVNRSTVSNAVGSALASAEGLFMPWQNVENGPIWVPVINQTEASLGIPKNLLARIAYQESRFRPDVIDGTTPSSAGALGIMQLEPKYFASVRVPTPFTAGDVQAQI